MTGFFSKAKQAHKHAETTFKNRINVYGVYCLHIEHFRKLWDKHRVNCTHM